MDDTLFSTVSPTDTSPLSLSSQGFKIGSPKIDCSLHGVHDHYIQSTIPGHEGAWCMICLIEKLGPSSPMVTTHG